MVEHDLPGQAASKGEWVLRRLRQIESPLIRDVRGLGLMIGIELRQRTTPYVRALMERGILALIAGRTVLRLLPPLVISDQDLATVCDAIEEVLP
jgi:acetylornithine/LysW-gamma-L-lysine aminotransferase